MAEQQNELFYFEQDPQDLDGDLDSLSPDPILQTLPPPPPQQPKPTPKEFYKIDDTNRLSVNFFSRSAQNQNQTKDIILTKLPKKGGKDKKMTIEPMEKQKHEKEQGWVGGQEKEKEEEKSKTSIFWEEENEGEGEREVGRKQQVGKGGSDSEGDLETITFPEDLVGRENRRGREHMQKVEIKSAGTQRQQQSLSQKQTSSRQTIHEEPPTTNNTQLQQHIIRPSTIKNIKSFILTPIPKGSVLQCTIKRDRQGLNRLFPQFTLYTTDGIRFLMAAKKRSGNTTSNYLISSDRNNLETKGDNYIGKLRSNWMGTEFVGYDSGYNPDRVGEQHISQHERKQLCEIHYESNFMGSRGPRVMDVYVPSDPTVNRTNHNLTLKQCYDKKGSAVKFTNKRPKWNPENKTYVLNFGNRVEQASVKNFLLVEKGRELEERHCVLFGKVNSDVYSLDVRYPMSPLQAFQIALSSLDHKIGCE